MDYKELFDNVMYEKYDNTPFSDNEAFISTVKERMKNMKTEDKNVHVGRLTEIEVPHYEKKKHGAAGVTAGAVLAAAAIAGTVFGLNTYGGLKENSVGTGAAYHDDTGLPAQSEPAAADDAVIAVEDVRYIDIAENNEEITGFSSIIMPPEEYRKPLEGAFIETEKCDITMNWLTFDGMTLKLQYDVTFRTGLPESGYIPAIVAYGDNSDDPHTTHGSRVGKLAVNGNTVSYIGEIVYNKIMTDEPIKIMFRDAMWNNDSDYEEYISFLDKESGVGILTPEMPETPVLEYDINKEASFLWGEKFTVASVTLCRDSVMFTIDHDLSSGAFNLHETYLVMDDGRKISLDTVEDKGGSGVGADRILYHYQLPESIDTSAVTQVFICGECVYDRDNITVETADITDKIKEARKSRNEYTAGDTITLADGSTALVKSFESNGRMGSIVFEVHSDDPGYYDNKLYYSENGDSCHPYVINMAFSDTDFDVNTEYVSDENGCTITYTFMFFIRGMNDGSIKPIIIDNSKGSAGNYAEEPIGTIDLSKANRVLYSENVNKMFDFTDEGYGCVYIRNYEFDGKYIDIYYEASLSDDQLLMMSGKDHSTGTHSVINRAGGNKIKDLDNGLSLYVLHGVVSNMNLTANFKTLLLLPDIPFLISDGNGNPKPTDKYEFTVYYSNRQLPRLNAGDSYGLDDGATATIDGIWYDGFMLRTQITVHSDDPDYYQKKVKGYDGRTPRLPTGLTPSVGMTGVDTSVSTDENGCDMVYTYYAMPSADTEYLYAKIWDDSMDRDTTAGYIEYGGLARDTAGYTRTLNTESDELGRRELTVSPYGFRLVQEHSSYKLDPPDNALIIVKKDGEVLNSSVKAAGEENPVNYAVYQMLFGVFGEPLDLDDIHSLTFFGETFVLDGEQAE